MPFLPPSQQCQWTEGTGAYVGGENSVFIPPLMEERSIVMTVSVCEHISGTTSGRPSKRI